MATVTLMKQTISVFLCFRTGCVHVWNTKKIGEYAWPGSIIYESLVLTIFRINRFPACYQTNGCQFPVLDITLQINYFNLIM